MSWADESENEEFLGRPSERFETEPDENGIKTVTEYEQRGGKLYKVTKRVRVFKRPIKVNVRAEQRLKNWKKFGKATVPKEDNDHCTEKQDDVVFEFGAGRGKKTAIDKQLDKEMANLLHSAQCKAQGTVPTGKFVPRSLRPGGARVEEEKKVEAPVNANTYKPPSMRRGEGVGPASMGGPNRDTHTVRVTNLPDDVNEQDLRDLFGQYGGLQRVFLAKDRQTQESKGFAFINFYNRADAERAIEKVSGFGYNHLILQVEWARPTQN
eukprot:TRINITY_DN93786_c0_g1_i1.p2 TRINITY_DN93786_c0_g1~~TRINITY_DN93786_c0_g1_i1.p2  ORF type:complete len:267 (+),score=57.52 TRINITY_DN93786_c0_g1_i1:1276-2076(+)